MASCNIYPLSYGVLGIIIKNYMEEPYSLFSLAGRDGG